MDGTIKSVSVFGLGYVGAVTAACLAKTGSRVVGVDLNAQKAATLEAGRAPVLEPGLGELVAEGRASGRLHASGDASRAVRESDLSFLCVGTPSLPNGRADLRAVVRCCQEIGAALRSKTRFHWIVVRSTVLPGTSQSVIVPTLEEASGKRAGTDFAVCANPEFTREGCAIADFMDPEITVLGADDPAHLEPLRDLYRAITSRVFETSLNVAEMVKYVCNAFHALKVDFANEIGAMCQRLNVDASAVMKVFSSDARLNVSAAYLTPGFAFGGSCLPKDVHSLLHCGRQLDLDLPLLSSILPSNRAHLERAVETVLATRRRKVGVLGLSFKPGTDDLRNSPSVQLIKRLLGEGCQVRIWDREVSLGRLTGSNRQFIEEEIPHIGMLLSPELEPVIRDSEVIVLGTKTLEEKTVKAQAGPDRLVIALSSPRWLPEEARGAGTQSASREREARTLGREVSTSVA